MKFIVLVATLLMSLQIHAAEKVVYEMNLYDQPESCINFHNDEQFIPEPGSYSNLMLLCRDMGFDYYISHYYAAPYIYSTDRGSHYITNVGIRSFVRAFNGYTFEMVDDEVISYYVPPAGKGGKKTYFTVHDRHSRFGVFASYDENNEFNYRGKIQKLDDGESIRVIKFIDNNAPILTQVNLTQEPVVNEDTQISFDTFLAASDALDEDGDALSFMIEELGTASVKINGIEANIGDIFQAGDTLTVNSSELGLQEFLKVSAFDGELTSEAVAVELNVITRLEALNKQVAALEESIQSLDEELAQLSKEMKDPASRSLRQEKQQVRVATIRELNRIRVERNKEAAQN